MKNFYLFVLFFALMFSINNICQADTSNIGKLAFITNPQTIAPNEISKEITLQIQDSSGNKVVALETIRFDSFQSTSPTGTFVSCTTPTNPPTDYISKNGSNKNICYRDSAEGTFTITAKTNNTVNPLVATQQIIITSNTSSSGTSSTATSSDSTATSTATTTSSTSDTQSGSSYYVYSSSASLSTYEPISLNVEAGRERLAFLHTPLEFKSTAIDKKSGKDVYGARYTWTFGDGTSAEGSEVKHIYAFPGEYNVVLNSYSGNEEAVDVTKVRVVPAEVKIYYTDSYIEFVNEGSSDLNIGGWKIKGSDREYYIPEDTIISLGGSIKIPISVIGSIGGEGKLSVMYPDNQFALDLTRGLDENKQKQISEISQKLIALQNELDLAYAKENSQAEYVDVNTSHLISESDVKKPDLTSDKNEEESMAGPLVSQASQDVLSKIVEFFATMFK